MQHNKEQFSNVKIKRAHNYKTHESTNGNKTRHVIVKGELNRDECNDDDLHQFWSY